MHEDAAREAFGADDVVKLASNESPWGPASGRRRGASPGLRRASTAIRTSMPGRFAGGSPSGSRSTPRGSRSATAPARSCWPPPRRCASRATRSSSRGRRSRSTRTWRRSPEPARSACRSPTATCTTSTRCSRRSPRRPSSSACAIPTTPPAPTCRLERIAEFCERVPDHVTVALDEAYVEFQTRRRPRRDASTCWRSSRTWWSCGRSARSTASPACAAATRCARPSFRAAVDAVRQPFSVNELAQVAAAEAILHGDDVAERVERTIVERVFVEEGLAGARPRAPDLAGELLLGPARRPDEAEVIRGARRAGHRGAGRRGPRRARATSGSPTGPGPRTSASSPRSATPSR